MADRTAIEWTDATWNPIVGCSVVSPGCTNCYAMRLAGTRLKHSPSRQGLTIDAKAGPVWNGEVRLMENWLDQPLRWKQPRRIFVCAHGDLFHEKVPEEWLARVFNVMAACPQHTFQVLTKRAGRMREVMCGPKRHDLWSPMLWHRSILPNVWLGVSVEDQRRADERIPDLLATPAAKRFISAEPLLGWIDLSSQALGGGILPPRGLSWVIVGGESGPNARPMHPDWVRDLRGLCTLAEIPFFFKQWGEWREFDHCSPGLEEIDAGTEHAESVLACAVNPAFITWDGRFIRSERDIPENTQARLMERLGKKAAGALLDGREWREMPT